MKKIVLFLINCCYIISNDDEYVKDLNDRLGFAYFQVGTTRDKLTELTNATNAMNGSDVDQALISFSNRKIKALKDSINSQEKYIALIKYKISEAQLKKANLQLEITKNEFHRAMSNGVVGFLSFEENEEIDQLTNSINEQEKAIELIKSEMVALESIM